MFRSKKSLLLLGLVPALAFSYPPTMDMGTFTIDNYVANGGGLPNLTFQIASGQNFFSGANLSIPEYLNILATGTGKPNFAVDRRDTQVSKAAITSTSSGGGNREYCDFFFYGGHGLPGGLYLGAAGGYGGVVPGDLNLGVGYNRWFVANACNLFNNPQPPATHWQPAFKGLKAMLGFKSVVFDNNESWQLYYNFWVGWSWYEKSLLNAYFDAQANYGYAHLFPAYGLEPGCLSAQVPAGRIDYCRESFKWVDQNYTPAIQNTGYYYSRVIGSPIY
jgi:hypothetical protein